MHAGLYSFLRSSQTPLKIEAGEPPALPGCNTQLTPELAKALSKSIYRVQEINKSRSRAPRIHKNLLPINASVRFSPLTVFAQSYKFIGTDIPRFSQGPPSVLKAENTAKPLTRDGAMHRLFGLCKSILSISPSGAVDAKSCHKNGKRPLNIKQLRSIFCLVLILSAHLASMIPVFAQTHVVDPGQNAQGSQDPSGSGRTNTGTVRNPYEDAIKNMYETDNAARTNQNTINKGVDRILTGESAPLVFQAAEQGNGGEIQRAANNVLNASLGSVNDTYRGMHQWFKDDLVGNLFSNIGQLICKWLTELINGAIADCAQYLGRFLRIFVLNPNIAINGLNGSQNDGISPYIRQGADVMYGIAVDLLLLLFILCIWKNWADASWGGAGHLMSSVGRLIFTAGLMLAWPTLYAFEVQISNEMIKAIYFNSGDQVLMLDYALSYAIKGGVIAVGAGAFSVFAPILANLAIPVAGTFVGSLFYMASVAIFTLLGTILIVEMVYILVLKAIQTALLTAQYMFAPIFLVFFATPVTEDIGTTFVRSFVEVSLWTFIWVGLLKVMVIIMFSNFNPWGKILISIGVLQLMIQVPAFMSKCQIGPASEFVTAGMFTGAAMGMLTGFGKALTGGVDKGINWFANDRFADKGLQNAKDAPLTSLPQSAANQNLLNSLNNASATERNRNKQNPGADPSTLGAVTPPIKTPGTGDKDKDALNAAAAGAITGQALNGIAGPVKPGDKDAAGNTTKVDQEKKNLNPGAANAQTVTATGLGPGPKKGALMSAGVGALLGAALATKDGSDAVKGANGGLPPGAPPDGGAAGQPADKFEWGKSTPEGWNESNLVHVDTRKLIGKLTSVDGVGLRVNQDKTSVLGSAGRGVQRVNVAKGANESEMAHAIYSAAFANNVSSDDPAKDAVRQSVIDAGGAKPRGMMEGMAANWLSNTGSGWNRTAMAKERFQQSMFEQAAIGSMAYVAQDPTKANAYTNYLRQRYGEWGPDQDAMACHLISNPESSESPWNRNVGPATENCVASGVPIGADTRGAMQNMAIQAMHPARRKQAVFAALSATYQQAKALYGDEHPAVMALGHGEMARAMSADDVNTALAMYQVNGQEDLNSSSSGTYLSSVAGLSSGTGRDASTAYTCLATAAPYAARRLGRISPATNINTIHSLSDLEAVILPAAGETSGQAMQVVLQAASSGLGTFEQHKIPMSIVTNPSVAGPIYDFLGSDVGNMNSVEGHKKLNIVSKSLGALSAPTTTHSLQAMYEFMGHGGELERMDQVRIQLATRAYEEHGAGAVTPHVIEVAASRGYGAASAGSAIPWAELEKNAQPYVTGQVTDYRLAGVVSQLQAGGINPSRTNIQLAIESMAQNGGQMNAEQVTAVLRVAETMRSSSSSPQVFEQFARVTAQENGIDTRNMAMGEVLGQLQAINISPSQVASQVVQIQRAGGGFSDYQMQDPVIIQMLVENSGTGSHPMAPQAINVVTKLLGSSQAQSNYGAVEVVQEFLDNDGKMRDVDLGSLNAAIDLAAVRSSMASHDPGWNNVKISPQLVKMVQRDAGYSVVDHQMSPDLIDRIIRSSNRTPGSRP